MKVSRRATVDRYYLASWRGWAVFLHRIHRDEQEGVYHSHPWSWVSVILGSYTDHRFVYPWGSRLGTGTGTGTRSTRSRVRQFFNWCRAGEPHRVTLHNGPVWTICIHAPRVCPWATFDQWGQVIEREPWRGTDNPERTEYGGAVSGVDQSVCPLDEEENAL